MSNSTVLIDLDFTVQDRPRRNSLRRLTLQTSVQESHLNHHQPVTAHHLSWDSTRPFSQP